jgi:hypothetical protein
MPTQAQQLNLSGSISAIHSAEQLLSNVVATSGDPQLLADLTAAQQALDSLLTTLLQAQAAVDDATFNQTTANLKAQAATLKAEEATVQKVISNVALAAQIVGYIAQAVTFILAI